MVAPVKTSAVAEKKTTAVALAEDLKGNWEFEGDAADILIPRLLVGQSTSEAVQKDKVSFGQVYRSTTAEAIGGKGKPFAIIPLHMTKTWVVSIKKPGSGKFEFMRIEPFNLVNKDLPWTWSEEKIEYKREANLNFFCLLPDDVSKDMAARKAYQETGELPDLEASLLPCVLSFKSTSYKAGKTLVTHFAKASDFKLPAFVNFFQVDTELKENDAGRFFILKLDRGGKTSPEHITICKKWHDIVSKSNVRVDETDSAGEEFSAAEGPAQF